MTFFQDFNLHAKQLSCWRDERFLFNDINFSLKNGQALQITGENGSGKSSLLRIIAGLLRPTAGEVIGDILLSYVGHEAGIKATLSVEENCFYFTEASSAQVDLALKQVVLQSFKDTLCQYLSAGQKRRIALARTLLQQRPLWLLDEPFTALDAVGCEIWQTQMQEHLQKGGAIVFTSHQQVEWKGVEVKELKLT